MDPGSGARAPVRDDQVEMLGYFNRADSEAVMTLAARVPAALASELQLGSQQLQAIQAILGVNARLIGGSLIHGLLGVSRLSRHDIRRDLGERRGIFGKDN